MNADGLASLGGTLLDLLEQAEKNKCRCTVCIRARELAEVITGMTS